ncbi:hypothetical protein [Geothrix sp. PMB-07]|uniref:hypothetical protein n=1 Tax=Geothrix sp. PMB-07 TaxID=3068640 RepID=UPI0027421478|nr:hypothetical protein [Geothrix sp. PMB-07]WLT30209.1 hypothetical protein Q9293_10815 [Geothrix sp. PMB-07]
MTWKPSPRAEADHLHLPLDPMQGYLLSRLDGTLDVPMLAALMNLEERHVAGMLDQLVHLGAVVPENAPAMETERVAPGVTPAPREGPPAPREMLPAPVCDGSIEGDDRLESDDSIEEDTPQTPAKVASYRQLFEQHLHPRPLDQRVAQAQVAVEPDLSAWCFDPTAEVIRALLENPRTACLHARLVASHHRTTAGLEAVCGRTAFTNDAGVRRALLQNPLLPAGIFRRLWSNKRLLEQFLVATSHDFPDQTRAMARDLLRATFNQRAGEERAELILSTEGRCLASLVGCTIDSHATAILCRRTYTSTLLIQNIARWSAAPPQLIAHLRRQDLVKRNPSLRQMLERHPNAT